MRAIARWLIGIALLFGILLFTLPKKDPESLSKIASASMLMCTLELRERVARQVISGTPVQVEFTNTCPDLIASLQVDEHGGMVITGNKHPLTMTLTPLLEGDKVRWSCVGEPASSVTKLCRP